MPEKIIEMRNVNKWFGDFQVLKNIDLEVEKNKKIVVCGPSGSGKSTLIRCINRLEEHQEGNIIVDGTFQMQISSLDYSSFVGAIGIGRVTRGIAKKNMQTVLINSDGTKRNVKISQLLGFHGLERHETDSAAAGDIVGVVGIENISISDTICDPSIVEALPPLSVDEPTVSMAFRVNDSPFAGLDGKYITSRNIKERLDKELIYNVALRVEDTEDASEFLVSGRGELSCACLPFSRGATCRLRSGQGCLRLGRGWQSLYRLHRQLGAGDLWTRPSRGDWRPPGSP